MTQTDNTNPTPRPLVGLKVRNFKRLQFVELDIGPAGVTQVRGRNEQGKSTLLDAALLALGKGDLPERPIHAGADSAEIVLTIGHGKDQLVARRVWTDPEDRTRTKMTLERADGAKYPRPTEVLAEMLKHCADPVAMMRMRPQDVAQAALSLVQVPLDLAAHATQVEVAEQRRRDAGRDLKKHEAAQAQLEQQASGAPDAPVDVAELAGRLADVSKAEADRAAMVRDVAQCDRAVAAAADAYQRAQRAAEEALEALQRAEQVVRDEAQRHKAALEEAEQAQARLAGTPEPNGAALRQQLADAKATNAAYERRRAADRATTETEAARLAHTSAENALQRLRQQRLDALAQVAWPHPGMAYDPDAQALTLNGQPWTQCSTAELLLACAALAMGMPSEIPALFVRAGNDLDAAHLAMLEDAARSRGWQVMLERVDDEADGPGVWIEDGEVRGGDAAVRPSASAQEVA
jgi:hypothetical protein